MRFSRVIPYAAALVTLAAIAAIADEGMWTYDNPPLKQLESKYNFKVPNKPWLSHLRLASVRLNDGGSGSFVSQQGLLLTNHHVALGQLQKNSTAQHDYVKNGFYAATQAEEMKSPDLEVNVLMSSENITWRIDEAMKGVKTPTEEFATRRKAIAALEKECDSATGLRCDVVPLYQGGEYWLYRYKKYTDVRLVFAPEQQIAFFGGDTDNFMYPRYDLDMALFRVYEDGRPILTREYLQWNAAGPKDGELVFVSGHPGSTQRLDTYAQLQMERDLVEPNFIKMLKRRIEILQTYSARGPEQKRQALEEIFGLQNSLKAMEGRYKGLQDAEVMDAKKKSEEDFKAKIKANPHWQIDYGTAWDDIAATVEKARSRAKERFFHRPNSELSLLAEDIVMYVAEIKRPDGERLPGYHDSQLESLRYTMFSPAPVYLEMEIARMAGALQHDLEEMGPSDPFVKAFLDGRNPKEAAEHWLRTTKMTDPAFRRKLVDGGQTAVEASDDPLIVLQRRLDPLRREAIKWNEENVETKLRKASEVLAKARFLAYGTETYPDATFTLRLSFGKVAGYESGGVKIPSMTNLAGLYEHSAKFGNKGDYALPARYVQGKSKLDLSIPFNFVSTADITGGNSGSPVVNRNAELVGLIFDGNIESLVGDFVYNEKVNRAVAVTTSAMTEVMRKLYGAGRLLDEMAANTTPGGAK